MAEFKKSIVLTLRYEGFDVYTDIKNDKGGPTRFGISLNFAKGTNDLDLFDLDNDGEITKEDIRLMDSERALEVYKEYFWDVA